MIKIVSLSAAGAFLAFGFSAAPAHARAGATFVSGQGSDSGVCTRASPCKTLAFALSQTAARGVILVLDPAGYGEVTITKAISIINDGVGTAGIGGSSGNAITINAGATDRVHLRGLTIEGFGSMAHGIVFLSGGNLEIENCVIRGFAGAGINIDPSTSSNFSVSNTIASDNVVGIEIQPPGSAAVTGVLSKVITNNNSRALNGAGIFVGASVGGGPLNVTIVDSVASNNPGIGVGAGSFAATAVMLRNVVASHNGTGLSASQSAVLRVAHSVVTGNGTGVNTAGGTIFSYGDNDIDGNTNNNTGVLTPLAMH